MTSLGPQFAQYSGRQVHFSDDSDDYDYEPLPASMERHAPGEYQPTLPGMEHMLKGEQVHTSVFFKNQIPTDDDGYVQGSNWSPNDTGHTVEHVKARDLHPTQDWVSDRELHEPRARGGYATQFSSFPRDRLPMVEKIGSQRAIMDGHHRAARAILNSAPQIKTRRWDA